MFCRIMLLTMCFALTLASTANYNYVLLGSGERCDESERIFGQECADAVATLVDSPNRMWTSTDGADHPVGCSLQNGMTPHLNPGPTDRISWRDYQFRAVCKIQTMDSLQRTDIGECSNGKLIQCETHWKSSGACRWDCAQISTLQEAVEHEGLWSLEALQDVRPSLHGCHYQCYSGCQLCENQLASTPEPSNIQNIAPTETPSQHDTDSCEPGYKSIVGHPFAGANCETAGLTCHANSDLTPQECAALCTGECIAYTQEFDHGWCHTMDSTFRDGYVANENSWGTEGFYCKKNSYATTSIPSEANYNYVLLGSGERCDESERIFGQECADAVATLVDSPNRMWTSTDGADHPVGCSLQNGMTPHLNPGPTDRISWRDYQFRAVCKIQTRSTDSSSSSSTGSPRTTIAPSPSPTSSPTIRPTSEPTGHPSKSPSVSPTTSTAKPSTPPSLSPSNVPTPSPTSGPTSSPTSTPSHIPSSSPVTSDPTALPTTTRPTHIPSSSPVTSEPTVDPTLTPTEKPSIPPSLSPSNVPTPSPTSGPTTSPTSNPSQTPSTSPVTSEPTIDPTLTPTAKPSIPPSVSPTNMPTSSPTSGPTTSPTSAPSEAPTTNQPSKTPSMSPTHKGFEGSLCNADDECDSLRCSVGEFPYRCREKKPHSEECQKHSDCKSDKCLDGKCVDGRENDLCNSNDDCDSGRCAFGVPFGKCQHQVEHGSSCIRNNDCTSGHCLLFACTDHRDGAHCVNDDDCVQGSSCAWSANGGKCKKNNGCTFWNWMECSEQCTWFQKMTNTCY